MGVAGPRLQWQRLAVLVTVLGAAALGTLCVMTGLSAYFQHEAERVAEQNPQLALREIAWAIRLRPDLAAPREDKAQWLLDTGGDLDAARREALSAVRRDGRDWRSWQLLGSIDLEQNRLPRASEDFQMAARYNQGFAGHYQLANFALAMGNDALFWREIRAALAVVPAWNAHFAISEILRYAAGDGDPRLPTGVPTDRPGVGAYMVAGYLSRQFWTTASEVLQHMECAGDAAAVCRDTAANYIQSGLRFAWNHPGKGGTAAMAQALGVWRMAAQRGWVPQPPGGSNLCLDGGFQTDTAAGKLGWTEAGPVNLAPTQQAPPGATSGLRIGFDGQEPEQAVLLKQYVVLPSGGDYHLSFASRSLGTGRPGGLNLELVGAGGRLLASVPATLGAAWTRNAAPVHVPEGEQVALLQLVYRRPAGQVRLKSPALVSAVDLSEKP